MKGLKIRRINIRPEVVQKLKIPLDAFARNEIARPRADPDAGARAYAGDHARADRDAGARAYAGDHRNMDPRAGARTYRSMDARDDARTMRRELPNRDDDARENAGAGARAGVRAHYAERTSGNFNERENNSRRENNNNNQQRDYQQHNNQTSRTKKQERHDTDDGNGRKEEGGGEGGGGGGGEPTQNKDVQIEVKKRSRWST